MTCQPWLKALLPTSLRFRKIDCDIKQRAIAEPALPVEEEADRPNLLLGERSLRSNQSYQHARTTPCLQRHIVSARL